MELEVISDTLKNILYIKIGVIERECLNTFAEAVEAEAKKLTRGFCCINDLRGFETDWSTITEEELSILKNTQKQLKLLGLKKTMRIFGNQPGFVIDLFRGDNELGYLVSNVASIEEAEKLIVSL